VKNKVVLPVFIQFRVNDSMQLNAVLGNSKLGSHMFYGADEFNQPLNFDTSKVTDMNHMFCSADKFNQAEYDIYV
jgi:surface protein